MKVFAAAASSVAIVLVATLLFQIGGIENRVGELESTGLGGRGEEEHLEGTLSQAEAARPGVREGAAEPELREQRQEIDRLRADLDEILQVTAELRRGLERLRNAAERQGPGLTVGDGGSPENGATAHYGWRAEIAARVDAELDDWDGWLEEKLTDAQRARLAEVMDEERLVMRELRTQGIVGQAWRASWAEAVYGTDEAARDILSDRQYREWIRRRAPYRRIAAQWHENAEDH